jgi:hypothetical protein
MNENKNYFMKTASFLIIALFIATPLLSTASGTLSIDPSRKGKTDVVGVFGDPRDFAIELGMNAYLESISKDYVELSFEQIQDFSGQIVIFAHGEKTGVRLSADLKFSWNSIASYLSKANAERIIFATCHGAKIFDEDYTGPELLTWNGKMDAILVGYAAAFYTNIEERTNIDFIMNGIFSRALAITQGLVDPAYLGFAPPPIPPNPPDYNTESGYEAAMKRTNRGSGFTSNRFLWFNFHKDIGYTIVQVALGIAPDLAELLVAAGVSTTVAVVIATVILVHAVLWITSRVNRIRADYKVGIQAYKYIPDLNFVYHLGNDNYKLDGVIYIPNPGVHGIAVYHGLSGAPTYWKPLNMGNIV